MKNIDKDVNKNLIMIKSWLCDKYGSNRVSIDSSEGYELFNDIMEFMKFSILGCCGCGDIDSTLIAIRDYLYLVKHRTDNNTTEGWNESKHMLKEKFGVDHISNDRILQYMAYSLDTMEFTDHGSSINGTWILDLGRIALYLFDLYFGEEDENNE